MAKYPFLSAEWISEARRIRDALRPELGEPTEGMAVRMNQIITEVPFGEGTIAAHMDTTSGQPEVDLGHLDDAEVTLTLDYATARQVFVDNDQRAAMDAFIAGKIKVTGDLTKLLTMSQAAPNDPAAQRVTAALQEITE